MAGSVLASGTAAVPAPVTRPATAERAENFPVALRLLPATLRADLRAVYVAARGIDDVGDDPAVAPAERLRALDALDEDLRRIATGQPPHAAVLGPLAQTVRRRGLAVAPFAALVEANREDQRVARWASWAELRRYCALSADPVGRIVLDLFGVRDAAAAARSDDVCTALQLLEHCQDVREDYLDRDRVYLPADEMLRFGVSEADLGADSASPQLRRLLAFEVDRAERLLASGPVLVRGLNGWARVAVAGYVAGGLATVAALRRAGYDVLAARVRPRKADVVRRALALVVPRPAAGGAVWPPGAGDRR